MSRASLSDSLVLPLNARKLGAAGNSVTFSVTPVVLSGECGLGAGYNPDPFYYSLFNAIGVAREFINGLVT